MQHLRRAILILACLTALRPALLPADPPAAAKAFVKFENNKCCLVDARGRALTPAKYDKLDWLADGYFKSEIDGRRGLVDARGTDVIPAEYEYLALYEDRFVTVGRGNRSGLLDLRGRPLIPLRDGYLIHYDAEKGTALWEGGAPDAGAGGLSYLSLDGRAFPPFADHWEDADRGQARLPAGTLRVFAERAGLRDAPEAGAAIIAELPIGAEVVVLSASVPFYENDPDYLRDTFGADGGYRERYELTSVRLDRWLKVKAAAQKKEGYLLESRLTRHGLYEDLDGDGAKDLLLLKEIAYHFYKAQGDASSYNHERVLSAFRAVKNNTMTGELEAMDFLKGRVGDAGFPDYRNAGVGLIKVPGAGPKYLFVTVAWKFSSEEGYSGQSLKPYYYFTKGRFFEVDLESGSHRGGTSGDSKKTILWDAQRGIPIMKETIAVADHGYGKLTEKQYDWDRIKMKFILVKEKVISETASPF